DAIRARQECLTDLRDRLDLREDFALEGESASVGVQPDALLKWESTPNAFEDLRLFAGLLTRIERETFTAPALRELTQRLSSHTLPASTTIRKLSTIVGFIEARRNIVLALLQLPLVYPLVTALAAERWRKAHGAAVGPWVEVLGEIEALLSLAAYTYEHPSDPFPEIIDGAACFEATAL